MTRLGSLAALCLSLAACSDVTTNLASDPKALLNKDAGRARSDAAVKPDAAPADAAASTGPRTPASCGGHACACDDGIDNDGDGYIDGFDPECTIPSDDDESSFATGAPTPKSRCRDCFWDDNAGGGNDSCRYPAECLNAGTPPGKGSCSSCDVSAACTSYCQQRTPNGCDCFGCCEITRPDGSTVQVELSDTCSLAKLDDASACPRCSQQSATCRNPCGHCELCPGRTPAMLPADCTGGQNMTPRYVCEEAHVCSETIPCASGQYCLLGCCLASVE